MPAWLWIVIAIVVLALLALAAWTAFRRRRSARLRGRFGPEYERAVDERGRRQGESELEAREKRRERLEIRPLAPAARDRYVESWSAVQERFVDVPGTAVGDADRLVTDVMRQRGYPMDDFEQRAADISVDRPDVVENYRAAHAIYVKNSQGAASTEELRQAFVHYRALFEDLLETEERPAGSAETAQPERAEPAGGKREARGAEPAGGGGERPVVREDTQVRRLEDDEERVDVKPGATSKRDRRKRG